MMATDPQVLRDIAQMKQELMVQIREELDHLSEGIHKAIIGLQEAISGVATEVDPANPETTTEIITNPIFYI